MPSPFQSARLVSSPCYPNAVVWSEENLVAVASGNVVTILNPAKLSGPGSRGVISIPSSNQFPVGVINGGWEDLLSGCMLPVYLSQETRPCVRSISWSPVGLAKNAGCLLAACTTSGRIKLYRFPLCEASIEWVEVLDVMEILHDYLLNMEFGESQITSSENVVASGESMGNECTGDLPVTSLRKGGKRKRQKTVNISCKESDKPRELDKRKIVPLSVSDRKPPEKGIKDSNGPTITVQQYTSRNAMLTPLIVAWSPILRTFGKDIAIPHNSLYCCSILAAGLKSGRISLWRIYAPDCYSIVKTGAQSCKASLIGLPQAHDTWITSIDWALTEFDISKPQLLLAAGSSDGKVKIWQINVEDMLLASEVIHASFSLMEEVTPIDSSPVSVLSLTVPLQTPLRLLLAIGKGSGLLEVQFMEMRNRKFERIGCYSAHNHIVTGLAWAFDGRCLYSCSQDSSMKSWIFVGNSLHEVNIPGNTPGLKSSADVPYVFDSCFGLAVSPGNLAMAVARRFDSDLLNPMYQERTQKAVIDFLWIGGQQLDTSLNTCPDIKYGSFPGFTEEELIWWENNILWSFNWQGNINRLLNVWDIVAALLSFKQCIPNYVEHILLKWLKSYFGSQFGISATFEASKGVTNLSSRQLHLINIISRHVVLQNCKVGVIRGKHEELEGLSCTIEEQANNVWMELHMNSENELRNRLIGFSFSVILCMLSNSTMDLCEVGCWSPDEWPQLEQWVSLNDNNVTVNLKYLVEEVDKFGRRRLQEILRSEVDEHCSFCSAFVPFESTEYAICSGVKCDDGVYQSHKLERCAVSMRVCSSKCSWFCVSCQRRLSKLPPLTLFTMPRYLSDFRSILQSSDYKEYSTPCCPFCGILLQKLQPEYFLSPSPV